MHLWLAVEVRDACSCRVIAWGYWTRIDIGRGKYRGLVRVPSWHDMPLSPPIYAPRAHHHTTSTHMHQYTYWSMFLYSVLLLLHSCFTPALSIIELSFCFINTRVLLLIYSYFVPVVILFYWSICMFILLLYSYLTPFSYERSKVKHVKGTWRSCWKGVVD